MGSDSHALEHCSGLDSANVLCSEHQSQEFSLLTESGPDCKSLSQKSTRAFMHACMRVCMHVRMVFMHLRIWGSTLWGSTLGVYCPGVYSLTPPFWDLIKHLPVLKKSYRGPFNVNVV